MTQRNGSQPVGRDFFQGGLPKTAYIYHIFVLQFSIVAKLQLRSHCGDNFMAGMTMTGRTVLRVSALGLLRKPDNRSLILHMRAMACKACPCTCASRT